MDPDSAAAARANASFSHASSPSIFARASSHATSNAAAAAPRALETSARAAATASDVSVTSHVRDPHSAATHSETHTSLKKPARASSSSSTDSGSFAAGDVTAPRNGADARLFLFGESNPRSALDARRRDGDGASIDAAAALAASAAGRWRASVAEAAAAEREPPPTSFRPSLRRSSSASNASATGSNDPRPNLCADAAAHAASPCFPPHHERSA